MQYNIFNISLVKNLNAIIFWKFINNYQLINIIISEKEILIIIKSPQVLN